MKLLVSCKKCNFKIYITHPAKLRQELPSMFELACSNCAQKHYYYPPDVTAEPGLTPTAGAVLGGLLGLTLGGPGALAGAILGGLLGKSVQQQDERDVKRFNES